MNNDMNSSPQPVSLIMSAIYVEIALFVQNSFSPQICQCSSQIWL